MDDTVICVKCGREVSLKDLDDFEREEMEQGRICQVCMEEIYELEEQD